MHVSTVPDFTPVEVETPIILTGVNPLQDFSEELDNESAYKEAKARVKKELENESPTFGRACENMSLFL